MATGNSQRRTPRKLLDRRQAMFSLATGVLQIVRSSATIAFPKNAVQHFGVLSTPRKTGSFSVKSNGQFHKVVAKENWNNPWPIPISHNSRITNLGLKIIYFHPLNLLKII